MEPIQYGGLHQGTAPVYGQHVCAMHDGHCSSMRWRLTHSRNTEGLYRGPCKPAVKGVKSTAEAARNRPPASTVIQEDTQWRADVHCGSMGLCCHTGRHRAVIMANETAAYARERGATVTVIYASLYRGAVDQRWGIG